ncbi:hypothetical protein PM082_014847 [Marasmius tenuissimus]|nr:hypothetical protein PM082_014847 [Marasmius tenuissimus]
MDVLLVLAQSWYDLGYKYLGFGIWIDTLKLSDLRGDPFVSTFSRLLSYIHVAVRSNMAPERRQIVYSKQDSGVLFPK